MLGLVPLVIAVQVVFGLLRVVDQGAAFAALTVTLLRRLCLPFGWVAVYLVAGLVGVGLALGQLHPAILRGWLAAEVVILSLLTVTALPGRLFAAALELRQDNELTV